MINRWVARVFAGLLTGVHVFVVAALLFMIIAYVIHQQGLTAQIGRSELAFDPTNVVLVMKLSEMISQHIFVAYVLAAFLIYVVIVGSLATLIAINQNLERLNKSISGDYGVDPENRGPKLRYDRADLDR